MTYLCFLCLLAHSGVIQSLFFLLCLSVSLDCSFVIALRKSLKSVVMYVLYYYMLSFVVLFWDVSSEFRFCFGM